MNFGTQFKALRESLGLTQAEAAAILEHSKSAIEKWEAGKKTPAAITQEGAFARLAKLQAKLK